MIELSVVIPAFNEERYLGACLRALDEQTLSRRRFEVIVIDNGSTDATLEILEGWPRVRPLAEPRRDPYLARNRGIEAARGAIIAFTDADCAAAPDWLERIERAFRREDVDIAVGRLAYPGTASRWLRRYADYYDTKTRWTFESRGRECLYGHGGNMAVRASLFQTLGPFPPMPCVGDTEILHRAVAELETPVLRYLDDAVVTHLEVERLTDLLPKLGRYGRYADAVQRSTGYRTLSLRERLGVMVRCVRTHRYGVADTFRLLGALGLGVWSFERGRLGRGSL